MRTRVVWMLAGALALQAGPRARDLGIPLDGTTGPLNAITDVAGVEVGLTTLIEGESVRTGVTVVLPRGKASNEAVFAGWHSLNGNGEMTGTTWIEESGLLEGPVAITNTHSVGVVRDALVAWGVRRQALQQAFSLPVVAETWDGWLNDANGFHVRPEHVFAALEKAAGGAVAEGNTGGGTGMICYRFKGGTGTASRRAGRYTLGVLVQANFGLRAQLTVAGVPVGRELNCARYPCRPEEPPREGSIIAVAATDAPLLPHQLKRLARRVSLGLARTGSVSTDSSGDIFIAFSTANRAAAATAGIAAVNMLPNPAMNPLFEAVVEATEEAVLNAMLAAGTMTGRNGLRVAALPHDALREALRKYNRLRPQPAAQ